jgi:50S ribosomal subunit-associated GTPase HflX
MPRKGRWFLQRSQQHGGALLVPVIVLQACIMVFDVTRKLTYKNLDTWYEELQHHAPGIPTLVVANKIDIDYQVGAAAAAAVNITLSIAAVCTACAPGAAVA